MFHPGAFNVIIRAPERGDLRQLTSRLVISSSEGHAMALLVVPISKSVSEDVKDVQSSRWI